MSEKSSFGKGPDQASLKLKVVAHLVDPMLFLEGHALV